MRTGAPLVIERRVRRACYLALVALALVVWSLLQPAPLPVIGAMTVGQVLGTVSLLFFLYAIGSDLRTALLGLQQQAMKTPAAMPPPDGGSAHTPE